jgi:putative copper export protein
MRSVCIAVLAGSLAASVMLAPLASAQPLSPGKPAGIHQARRGASTGLLVVGGLLVAGLVAVVAFSGSDNKNGVLNSGTSTTATTS